MTTTEREEASRCERGFQRYSSETRAALASSHRLGPRAKASIGEAFWTHPDLPGACFPTRAQAARRAVALRAAKGSR